ncbi:uncharacterized protein KQ657_003847 [Scheffersomyces spartinae]|uniref:HTH La-type RNA-binding domain-containing protein n=1 Tax=Scheffersomyces spartinae TaxID=45513 RepID=A0A9P7VC93_9ASCO|nr:uncharacterized protein KQ657_003847 [Scheffersomyces spartinae]KAG7195319.1 hypothetical protein KQ657_003847 [Scheffersomyces spartinae]
MVNIATLQPFEKRQKTMTDFVYQEEDFDDKVRTQVEFYFSDSNLQTDKFLWNVYQANDGWVDLKTILTFTRMKQYRPETKVIEALKNSDKLVLSANEEMIKRKDPLPDLDELKSRRKKNTVHIEGFPKDLTQEQIEEFFDTKIVSQLPQEKTVCSIRRMKNRVSREFFGVADVEFKTLEDAEFFLNKLDVAYPAGIVDTSEESFDKKSLLKKMSLLTFQEMRESRKRFGVNEVTKRRNSFNSNNNRGGKKFKKGGKPRSDSIKEDKETKEQELTEESKPETTETNAETVPKTTEAKEPESITTEASA